MHNECRLLYSMQYLPFIVNSIHSFIYLKKLECEIYFFIIKTSFMGNSPAYIQCDSINKYFFIYACLWALFVILHSFEGTCSKSCWELRLKVTRVLFWFSKPLSSCNNLSRYLLNGSRILLRYFIVLTYQIRHRLPNYNFVSRRKTVLMTLFCAGFEIMNALVKRKAIKSFKGLARIFHVIERCGLNMAQQ